MERILDTKTEKGICPVSRDREQGEGSVLAKTFYPGGEGQGVAASPAPETRAGGQKQMEGDGGRASCSQGRRHSSYSFTKGNEESARVL